MDHEKENKTLTRPTKFLATGLLPLFRRGFGDPDPG
jgi:hypothetical protein